MDSLKEYYEKQMKKKFNYICDILCQDWHNEIKHQKIMELLSKVSLNMIWHNDMLDRSINKRYKDDKKDNK